MVVDSAEGGDGDHLHLMFAAHERQRDQRAVFEVETVEMMGERVDAHLARRLGNRIAERRVARVAIGHVADELRKLGRGQKPLEPVVGIDMKPRVHQPVRVADHDGVRAQRLGPARDFIVAVDRGLPLALDRPVLLRHLHRRNVGHLGRQNDFTHDASLLRSCEMAPHPPSFGILWSARGNDTFTVSM